MIIIENRLAALATIDLAKGAHIYPGEGMCLVEAAAWVAGEPFSDHPECVCPVLAVFGRSWNDALPVEERNRILKPFILRLIGTRSTPDVEAARSFLAADWAVRVYAPVWLRAAGMDDEAAALEALPPLSSVESCKAAIPALEVARTKAYDAWVAAWSAEDAAWIAAGDAARGATGGAAGDAARCCADGFAAGDAARDAVGYVARYAAGCAARYAAENVAWDALAPHVAVLQASAADLYSRMIDLTEVAP